MKYIYYYYLYCYYNIQLFLIRFAAPVYPSQRSFSSFKLTQFVVQGLPLFWYLVCLFSLFYLWHLDPQLLLKFLFLEKRPLFPRWLYRNLRRSVILPIKRRSLFFVVDSFVILRWATIIIVNGPESIGHKRSTSIMIVKIGRIPVILCSFIMNSLTLFSIDISDIVPFGISSVQIELTLSPSLEVLL